MAEYIKREAFLDAKRKLYCADCAHRKGMKNGKFKKLYEIGDAPCRACGVNDVLEDVEDFPAADVREVVLCRDCRYYRQSNFVDKHMECARSGFPVHPVDFCSLADMREEQT